MQTIKTTTSSPHNTDSVLATVVLAQLKPLYGKYYGTYVELFDKNNNLLDEVKFWLTPIEYNKDNVSPREVEQAVKYWGEDWYSDWDWAHSESLLTYEMAMLFVNAVNNSR